LHTIGRMDNQAEITAEACFGSAVSLNGGADSVGSSQFSSRSELLHFSLVAATCVGLKVSRQCYVYVTFIAHAQCLVIELLITIHVQNYSGS